MDLGWQGLAPADPMAALSGYILGLGTSMAARTLFGGLQLRRKRRRRAKTRKRRR